MRMSKSRVDKYRNCPYGFALTYLENFREYNETNPQGSPLQKGTELHQIFEDYYGLPAAKHIKQPYGEAVYNILTAHPLSQKSHLEITDPEHDNLDKKWDSYELLQKDYNTHLSNFASLNEAMIRKKGVDKYMPVHTEVTLHNKKENFLGIIDRIDMNRDGTYTVLDYKTGRTGTLKKYLIELGLYKWLVEAELGYEVSHVGIYFSQNGKLRTVELDQEDVQRSLDTLHMVNENVKDKHFPRKIGFLCNFCENRDICDMDIDFDWSDSI